MHLPPQLFASSIVSWRMQTTCTFRRLLDWRAGYIVLDKSFKQCLISLKCLFERKSVFDHFDKFHCF